MTFAVTSNSFKDGDYLGQAHILSADFGFGCAGGNQSPHLAWSGAPAGTKSFAVTCFDPDAPTGSGFWHWLVVNIPPNITELALDAGNPRSPKLPQGALQTRTDFGAPGYGGPCPPQGDHPHRYLFTVFAVGAGLSVKADTSAAVIGFQLNPQYAGQSGDHGTLQALIWVRSGPEEHLRILTMHCWARATAGRLVVATAQRTSSGGSEWRYLSRQSRQ